MTKKQIVSNTESEKKEVVVSPITIASLDAVLMANFEALAGHLDIDAKRGDAAQDTGQSKADIGMKIVIGQMIGTIHNQLYGQVTGQKNLTQRQTEAYTTLNYYRDEKHAGRPEDFMIDNKALTALWWAENFDARVEALVELKNALCTVYERFAFEPWKPYVKPAEAPAATQVNEVTAAKVAALFKKTGNGSFVPKEAAAE